jgi:4-amino-4-deoxy-L-arabinose transferase-like glycosyltransferase
METPEERIAVVAREMIQSTNYVMPTLGGKTRLIKPPLPYWLTALTAKALAHGRPLTQEVMTRAVQIPTALCGALTVLLLTLFGGWFFGRAAGILAGLLTGFSVFTVYYAQLGYCDTILMFLCAGLFCSTAWLLYASQPTLTSAICFGLCLGLSLLTKWYIPVALVALPLLAEAALRLCWRRKRLAQNTAEESAPWTERLLLFMAGLMVFVIVAGPWFFYLELQQSGSLDHILKDVIYATEPRAHLPEHRWRFYFENFAYGFMPWTPLLLLAGAVYFWKRPKMEDTFYASLEGEEGVDAARKVLRFMGLTLVLGFLAFYSQAKQQCYYLLPLYPPVALLSGFLLSRFGCLDARARQFFARSLLILGGCAGLCLAGFPLWIKLLGLENLFSIHAREYVSSITLAGALPAGIVLAAALWFCARRFQAGRSLQAGGLIAAAVYGGALLWSFNAPDRARGDLLYTHAGQLKAQLEKMNKTARLYGAGPSEPALVFYLERPITTLKELAEEPQGQTGRLAPERILIATPDAVRKWHCESFFKDYLAQPIFLARLPRDVDWPKELKTHMAAAETEPANNE